MNQVEPTANLRAPGGAWSAVKKLLGLLVLWVVIRALQPQTRQWVSLTHALSYEIELGLNIWCL